MYAKDVRSRTVRGWVRPGTRRGRWIEPFVLLLMLTYIYGITPEPRFEKANWWLHALLILAFPPLILRSKHFHILMAPIDIFFRTFGLGEYVPLDLDDGEGPEHGPGQSVMLSGDKRFNGRWGLAGRYSRSFERLSGDYRALASLGFLWLTPLARSPDIAGLGLFVGDPSDPDRGTEKSDRVLQGVQPRWLDHPGRAEELAEQKAEHDGREAGGAGRGCGKHASEQQADRWALHIGFPSP